MGFKPNELIELNDVLEELTNKLLIQRILPEQISVLLVPSIARPAIY